MTPLPWWGRPSLASPAPDHGFHFLKYFAQLLLMVNHGYWWWWMTVDDGHYSLSMVDHALWWFYKLFTFSASQCVITSSNNGYWPSSNIKFRVVPENEWHILVIALYGCQPNSRGWDPVELVLFLSCDQALIPQISSWWLCFLDHCWLRTFWTCYLYNFLAVICSNWVWH